MTECARKRLWLQDGRSEGDPSLDPGWPLSTIRPSDGVCVDVIRAAMVEQGGEGEGERWETKQTPQSLGNKRFSLSLCWV